MTEAEVGVMLSEDGGKGHKRPQEAEKGKDMDSLREKPALPTP